MSHARRASKHVTTPMLRELMNIKVEGNNLFGLLDNTGMTIAIPYVPGHKTARRNLKDISGLSGHAFSDDEVTAAIGKIFDSHRGITETASLGKPQSVPREDFHRLYSLIYHMVPDSDRSGSRAAIRQVFEALKLDPPLPREDVAAQLPEILAMGDRKGRAL
jgi:hypothetical protein